MLVEALVSHSCGQRPCPHFNAVVDSTDVSIPLLSECVEGLGDLKDGAMTVFLVCRPRENSSGTLLEVSVGAGDGSELAASCICHERNSEKKEAPESSPMAVEVFAQTVERLTMELAISQNEAAQAKQDMDSLNGLKKQVEKLTEQLALALSESDGSKKELSNIQFQMEKVSARAHQLESECSAEREISRSLRKQLEDRISEHSEALLKIHALQGQSQEEESAANQLKALREQCSAMVSECSKLEIAARTSSMANAHWEQQVVFFQQKELDDANALSSLRRNLDEARSELVELREKKRDLEMAVSKSEAVIAELKEGTGAEETLQQTARDLEEELKSLRQKFTENSEVAKVESARMTSELSRAEIEIAKLTRDIGKSEVELVKAQNRFSEQEKNRSQERETLMRNLGEANSLAASRLEELEIARRSLEALRSQKNDSEASIIERLQLVSAECEKYREAALAADHRAAETAAECGSLQGHAKGLQEKIQILEETVRQQIDEASNIKAKNIVLEERVGLKSSEEMKKIEILNAELGRVRDQCAELEQRNKEAEARAQQSLEETLLQGSREIEEEKIKFEKKLFATVEEEKLKRDILEKKIESLEMQMVNFQSELSLCQKKAQDDARIAAVGMESARKLSAACAEEANVLKTKLAVAVGEQEQLRGQLSEMRVTIEAERDHRDAMRKGHEELESKLVVANRVTQDAQLSADRLRESSKRALEDNERLTMLLRSNEVEADQANARAQRAEATAEQLQVELRSSAVRIGVLEERAQRDAQEFKRHKVILDAAHREVEVLTVRNTQLEQEIRKLAASRDSLASGAKDHSEEIAALKSEIQENSALLDECRRKLKDERDKRKESDRRHMAELVAINAEKMSKAADWGRQVAGASLTNYQERPGVADLARARRGSRDEESSEGGGSVNTAPTVRIPRPPPTSSSEKGGWTEQVRTIRSSRAPMHDLQTPVGSEATGPAPLLSARDEKRIHPGVLTVPSWRGKRFYSCCGAEAGFPGCSFPK